jgi:hypothetical protein
MYYGVYKEVLTLTGLPYARGTRVDSGETAEEKE